MHVTLTAHHQNAECTWCEKEKDCVTANFDDGFIQQAPLCWSCLQKAIRVAHGRTRRRPHVRRAISEEALIGALCPFPPLTMSKRQFSLIGNWLVPDVLRPKPTPQWRQPLAESGTPWQRLGRLLWRAYRFAQPTGRSLVPGPGVRRRGRVSDGDPGGRLPDRVKNVTGRNSSTKFRPGSRDRNGVSVGTVSVHRREPAVDPGMTTPLSP